MRRVLLVAFLLPATLIGCGVLPEPPRPVPEECWFAHGEPLSHQGMSTMGQFGMGGPDGRWANAPMYVWLTAEPVDVWGNGDLTRGICGMVEDPAFVAEAGDAFVWNAWPLGQVPRGRDDQLPGGDPPSSGYAGHTQSV